MAQISHKVLVKTETEAAFFSIDDSVSEHTGHVVSCLRLVPRGVTGQLRK